MLAQPCGHGGLNKIKLTEPGSVNVKLRIARCKLEPENVYIAQAAKPIDSTTKSGQTNIRFPVRNQQTIAQDTESQINFPLFVLILSFQRYLPSNTMATRPTTK